MAYKVINADSYTYEGEVDENDIPNGQGKKAWRSGKIAEGEFKDGVLVKGKKAWSNGTILEGEFKDEFLVRGKKIKADGTVEEGEFKNGKLFRGKRVSRYGTILEGEFRSDDLNGHGKMILPEGDIYEGEFKDGELHGQGKVTCRDGTAYEGVWENGYLVLEGNCQNGQGKRVYCFGGIEDGEFKDGMLFHGKSTRPDGTVEEGYFEYGELDMSLPHKIYKIEA